MRRLLLLALLITVTTPGLAAADPVELLETDVLADIQAKGHCACLKKIGTFYYVFEDVLPRLTIRRCKYCGAEISLLPLKRGS